MFGNNPSTQRRRSWGMYSKQSGAEPGTKSDVSIALFSALRSVGPMTVAVLLNHAK